MNSIQLELKQVLKYFIDFNMFRMMKIKYKSWVSLLIVVGIFCLITSSCESIFEDKDPFKIISLGPLTDEIPFEELGSGKILFCRNNFLDSSGCYVIDIDQKRTYGFTLNSSVQMPYISPDGSKIACSLLNSADPNSTWNIYCMNIDGSNCFPVSSSCCEIFPTWTPDGLKILCYIRQIDGPLYMLSATENSTDRVELIRFYYGDDPDWCIDPSGGFSMSTDGQLVCASRCGSKTSGILKIKPYLEKSGVSLLLAKTNNEEPVVSVFSPDGTKIAFTILERDSLGYQQAIWIKSMDPDGTNLTPLVRVKISKETMLYTYWEGYPLISLCWSPDSNKILFNAPNEQNDGYHLMLVNADGTGLIQVTDKMRVNDLYVSWGR